MTNMEYNKNGRQQNWKMTKVEVPNIDFYSIKLFLKISFWQQLNWIQLKIN